MADTAEKPAEFVNLNDTFPDGLDRAWERFLFEGASPSLDKLFADPLCFPLQRRREMNKMLALAMGKNPKTVFEIGSDKGGGVFGWCQIPSVKYVIACEIRGVPFVDHFQRFFPEIDFLPLPHSSYEASTIATVRGWLKLRNTTIDVLFIDGDKSFFDLDFDSYVGLMSPGGVAFFHDITDEAPGAGFARVQERRQFWTEFIIDRSEATEACQREDRGIAPSCPHEGWLRVWRGKSCGVGVVYLPAMSHER